MATMRIDVVSAEEAIYSGDAEFVVLPGIAGELGNHPRHTPLITQIKAGTVRIKVPGSAEEVLVYVRGGFLEVQPDHVNVLRIPQSARPTSTRPRCWKPSAWPRKRCEPAPRRRTSPASKPSFRLTAQLQAIQKLRKTRR